MRYQFKQKHGGNRSDGDMNVCNGKKNMRDINKSFKSIASNQRIKSDKNESNESNNDESNENNKNESNKNNKNESHISRKRKFVLND